MGSGHVDTEKILGIWRSGVRYVIPLHEFLRAIIYGDTEMYDPASSPVPNAFDISSRNPREHFAMPILLNFLHRQAQHGSIELGFILLAKVYEHLQSIGFTVEDIDQTVTRCVELGLVESSIGAASERPKGAERLRLRQSGAYLVRRLLNQFVYYDAVVIDTPRNRHAHSLRHGSTPHKTGHRHYRPTRSCRYLCRLLAGPVRVL